MTKYIPLRDNVLVEKFEIQSSAIIKPSDGRWVRLKVISTGREVDPVIKVGRVVLAENALEKVDLLSDKYLILSKYIHLIQEEDGKQTN